MSNRKRGTCLLLENACLFFDRKVNKCMSQRLEHHLSTVKRILVSQGCNFLGTIFRAVFAQWYDVKKVNIVLGFLCDYVAELSHGNKRRSTIHVLMITMHIVGIKSNTTLVGVNC